MKDSEIEPVEHEGNRYRFGPNSNRFFVVTPAAQGAVVAGKIIWDVVLGKIISAIAEEVGKGIGQALIKRMFGGTEDDFAAQLQAITQKLDTILRAVIGLQDFIIAHDIQRARDTSDAKIQTHIKAMRSHLRGAAAQGSLQGDNRILFRDQVTALTNDLGELARKREEGIPEGLPMFVQVQAGLAMLFLGHRILGLPVETSRSFLKDYGVYFAEWVAILTATVNAMAPGVAQEAAAVDAFPKRGWLTYGNAAGLGEFDFDLGGLDGPNPYYACVANIQGGVNMPFKLIGIDRVPQTSMADSLNLPVFPGFNPALPAPAPYWWIATDGPRFRTSGEQAAIDRANHMVSLLNERRQALLDRLEVMRGLKESIGSIERGERDLMRLT
ncbi:hypothetical protein [Variovorax paradoxus]|uniref:hypothetical protein n=1 Tax=Variovorax paradoxus TaxID=34073 RepID=UPI0024811265|nr:hypothetical protein [Variovorax paradoxus]WGT62480.1 hypothetical protein QHG62_20850 [Variovorax paradoxus]